MHENQKYASLVVHSIVYTLRNMDVTLLMQKSYIGIRNFGSCG